MICTCPYTQLEAYARWHDLSEVDQWRRYYLRGKARTTRSEGHYPGCPLFRTREQHMEEQLVAFREKMGL